eukprot:11070733-Lingulodinium_polyedra.AAC.1
MGTASGSSSSNTATGCRGKSWRATITSPSNTRLAVAPALQSTTDRHPATPSRLPFWAEGRPAAQTLQS